MIKGVQPRRQLGGDLPQTEMAMQANAIGDCEQSAECLRME